jgi:hypothetical protein
MKVKTSFTISKETLSALERLVGKNGNRSAFVEDAVNDAIRQRDRAERDAKDLALFEKHGAEIQREIDESTVLLASVRLADARRRLRSERGKQSARRKARRP